MSDGTYTPPEVVRWLRELDRHARLPAEVLQQLADLAVYDRLVVMDGAAVFPTRDARIYCRVAPATWERMRSLGMLPPAIRLTDRLLGWRKRDLDAFLDARTEELEEVAA
jgi:hypothetical protein